MYYLDFLLPLFAPGRAYHAMLLLTVLCDRARLSSFLWFLDCLVYLQPSGWAVSLAPSWLEYAWQGLLCMQSSGSLALGFISAAFELSVLWLQVFCSLVGNFSMRSSLALLFI